MTFLRKAWRDLEAELGQTGAAFVVCWGLWMVALAGAIIIAGLSGK